MVLCQRDFIIDHRELRSEFSWQLLVKVSSVKYQK